MKQSASLDTPTPAGTNEIAGHLDKPFHIGELTSEAGLTTYPFRTDTHICCVCTSGECKGRINLIPHTLRAPGMSINLPGQLLEFESMSDDFKGVVILMSRDFVGDLHLPHNFQNYMSIQETPVLRLTAAQCEAMRIYCDMTRRVSEIGHPNRLDIIKHLTCAFFYGIGYYFHQTTENRKLSREEALMRDFLKTAQQHYKTERKVSFYAEKLHLTAGYLSTVIKNISGKTAAEWIDNYVTLEAKALLKSTHMTIQQISDHLNFPSQSFFGKYFKRQTGLSPKEYKNAVP